MNLEEVRMEYPTRRFNYFGYRCEVRKMPAGHLCGYVFVDNNHPFCGVFYNDLPDDFEPQVNGGLTYAQYEALDWVFGFDYAHYWNDGTETVDDVANDCKHLVEALREREGQEYVRTFDWYGERIPDAVIINGQRYVKEA